MENIIDFKIKKSRCSYFLKKNGKVIYYPFEVYDDFLCVLNNFKKISVVQFPLLIGRDEDQIIKKLLILQYAKKQDFKYVKTNNKSSELDNYLVYIFNQKNIDLYYFFLYFQKITKEKKIYDYYYGTILKKLTTIFMFLKITTKSPNNNKLLIEIFYYDYFRMLYKELYYKYNISLNDFPNYETIYLFLKNHGYVDKFYNVYSKIILKNYEKYYNNVINDPNFEKFKIKKLKNIKNFNDLNVLELVDKYVNQKFNKNYIKNKFIEIVEKYNI
jgi:hypothetical protein